MKSHLVHILPVWEACEVLGEPVVRRMVRSLLQMREKSAAAANKSFSSSSSSLSNTGSSNGANGREPPEQPPPYDLEEDLEVLTRSLFYRHPPLDKPTEPLPSETAHAWKRWLSTRNLAFDKATLIHFLVPHTVQPHSGPSGHMGLFDCLIYALQGHATNSSPSYYTGPNHNLMWMPDVFILLAAAKQYVAFAEQSVPKFIGNDDDPLTMVEPKSTNSQDEEENEQQWRPPSQAGEEGEDDQDETDSTIESLTETPIASSARKSAIAEATKVREEIGGEFHDPEPEQAPVVDPIPRSSFSSRRRQARVSAVSMGSNREQKVVRTLSRLAFRIYDSYQKKSAVTRDTVHRFLTDVHGEDSYKEEGTRAFLDDIFDDMSMAVGDLQATITENQFIDRILETFDFDRRTHLLLDWLAYLLAAMIPPPEIPPSVTAYLDTMEHRSRPLCDVYQIAESRLFEVRRHFHSMVRAGPSIIHGDPMGGDGGASSESAGSGNSSSTSPQQQPKHTISQSAFVDAVCQPNQELGHGGYMPESLAALVFAAGARNNPMQIGGSGGGTDFVTTIGTSYTSSNGEDDDSQIYWSLANLIQFGCLAVRQHISHPDDEDRSLLRFLFFVFSMATSDGTIDDSAAARSSSDRGDPHILTRVQVERMLLLMVEHADFRLKADGPLDQSEDERDIMESSKEKGVMVDMEVAYLLGILPSKMRKSSKLSFVALSKLVDHALESTRDKATMTFEEFCAWNYATEDGGACRLATIFMDLRLVASVLFGVPPSMASMEIILIAEIERRHKSRYPQTSVSRRGPRGTIWNIIDAEWLRAWAQRVKQVAGSEEDADDGRMEVKGGVRGLGRIENAGLLTHSTLALRQDIQWKHDYEILPPLAWQGLQAWYDGGPPIHRSVVRYVDTTTKGQSMHSIPQSPKARMPTENEIELYPYFVTVYLCDSTSAGEARPFQQNYQLSRVSPVGVMLVQLCKELEVDPSMARLWVLGLTSDGSVNEDGSKDWILSLDQNIVDQRKVRLDRVQIKKDIHLLLELKNRDSGRWPRGEDGKEWATRRSSKNSTTDQPAPEVNLGDGIVGLYNMG